MKEGWFTIGPHREVIGPACPLTFLRMAHFFARRTLLKQRLETLAAEGLQEKSNGSLGMVSCYGRLSTLQQNTSLTTTLNQCQMAMF